MKLQKKIPVELLRRKITRQIDVVQGDTGIQLLFEMMDFKIPDGTSATIYVQKPSGKFVYQEEDITVSSDAVTIDLHNQAIVEHGKCPYQVQLTNGSDTITTFAGFICVEKKYSDSGAEESKTVIVAFEEKTAEQIAKIEAAAQEQIEQIQNLYSTYATKTEAANAVKGNLSGAVVAAADVSPLEHNPAVWVHGKNLFACRTAKTSTVYGVTCTFQENSAAVILDGAATVESSNVFPDTFTLPKGTYTISVKGLNTAETGSDRVYLRNVETNIVIVNHVVTGVSRTFTLNEDAELSCSIVFREASTYNNKTVTIQIEQGNIETDHEEWIDPSTVTVTRCGKNFWHSRGLTYPRTVSGVTMDYDEDTQIYTFNGTSTAAGDLYTVPNMSDIMHINAGETWTLKVEVMGGTVDGIASSSGKITPLINTGDYSNAIHANNDSMCSTKTYSESADVKKMYFYIYGAGYVFNNFKVRIQFERNTKATEFEKFKELKDFIPSEDGTVSGITSLSPNMTILSDTEGVIVECEYNIDLMKFLENHSGGLDLAKLTVKVTAVEGGNQLSLSDGTTTKTVLIPTAAVTAEDIQAAVDNYLAENPVQNGKDGANGKDGQDGEDGLTPYIGENGNWWIGNTDTGVAAGGSGGSSEWVKIIDATLEEAATCVVTDVDVNGNPFSVKDIMFMASIAKDESASASYFSVTSPNSSGMPDGIGYAVSNSSNTQIIYGRTKLIGTRQFHISAGKGTNEFSSSFMPPYGGVLDGAECRVSEYTKIAAGFKAGKTMPAGTRIVVYGG